MLRRILGLAVLAVAGALVAIVGTGVHRAAPYFGVAIAIVLVLSTGVFARTWHRYAGLTVYAGAWIAIMMVLMYGDGPGGSSVFVDDSVGRAWVYGAAVAIVAVSFVPRGILEGGNNVASKS